MCAGPSDLLFTHLVGISNGLWAPGAGLSQVDEVGCDGSHGQGEVGPRKESQGPWSAKETEEGERDASVHMKTSCLVLPAALAGEAHASRMGFAILSNTK